MTDACFTKSINSIQNYLKNLSCFIDFNKNTNTFYIKTDTIIEGSSIIENNLTVYQNVDIYGNLFISQNFSYENLILTGNLTVEKDFIVLGNLVYDNLFLNGNLFINKNANILGNLYLEKETFLNSNLYVNQNANLNCNLYVEKDVEINGNLNVNGTINFSQNFNLFNLANRIELSNLSSYNALSGQYFYAITNMNQPLTISLPTSDIPTQNFYIIIDESGLALTYGITIQPFIIGQTISDAVSLILNVNYGSSWIYSVPNSQKYFVLFTRP